MRDLNGYLYRLQIETENSAHKNETKIRCDRMSFRIASQIAIISMSHVNLYGHK